MFFNKFVTEIYSFNFPVTTNLIKSKRTHNSISLPKQNKTL
jgi:hypothetical protein